MKGEKERGKEVGKGKTKRKKMIEREENNEGVEKYIDR